jgi:5-methylthioadenosine/S-adenosylhomocysteine deaminase
MPPKSADLLIANGTVLTLDDDDTRIENGAVAIADNKIHLIAPQEDFKDWLITRRIDAAGGIIMPGLINTHTHAAMTCFRGLADDLPLMNWLNDHIFPAESQLDDEVVFRGTLLACAEMIRSGTTCFCDMYLFEDAVARAASSAGMRAVVGEVLFDFPSPNYGPIEKGFAYIEQMIDSWRNNELITVAVEPHSPYLCAPDLLKRASTLAIENSLPLVTHLSETQNEVAQIKNKYQLTPVGLLNELGILGPHLLACHCVILNSDDIDLLKHFEVKVSHNAESNMKLASGIAPIPEMMEAGIPIGIGTDGCASNNNLDLFLEMDTVAKLHKVNTLDPTVMNASTVLRMATIEGARALGLDRVTGSLEPGKAADLIVIDTRKPHLTPMYNPVSHLIYAVRGSDVSASIINGKVVMEDGRLVTLDEQEVIADVNRIAQQIRIRQN